jgi:hypothetical protein
MWYMSKERMAIDQYLEGDINQAEIVGIEK